MANGKSNGHISAFAFIDAVITDIEHQFETRGPNRHRDLQLAFAKKLRAQLEQNSSTLSQADFSTEVAELHRLQSSQISNVRTVPMPQQETTRILSLFR